MRILASYIDPGTGSMLFTVLIGLLTTGYFFFKRAWIKLKFILSGGGATNRGERLSYVVFSDSKRYWNVFKPIMDEFEVRGIDAAFWTASPDDPALEEDYEHVKCAFIGEGNRAYAKLNMMSADICLATTPGLDVYQWKRSKDVSYYVHTLHAADTVLGYRMFGIDYYDALLLTGPMQIKEVRDLEEKRNLPAKELEVVGCTYLDTMAERLKASKKARHKTTVLLAPSWGESSILSRFGERIIQALIDTGFKVIVRPHPQSMATEREMMDALIEKFPETDSFFWNFDNDNFECLRSADIMISDFSGVVFDFALVFDKPVIYTEATFDTAYYDAAWFDEPLWKFEAYKSFGVELSEDQFAEMKEIIERVMSDQSFAEGREKAREALWSHKFEAAKRTVDYLEKKHAELMSAARDLSTDEDSKA